MIVSRAVQDADLTPKILTHLWHFPDLWALQHMLSCAELCKILTAAQAQLTFVQPTQRELHLVDSRHSPQEQHMVATV